MANSTPVDRIYDLHGRNTETILEEMNTKFLPNYGVKIHSFTIRNVSIPGQMAETMQKQTLLEAETNLKKKQQEHELFAIDHQQQQNRILAEQENMKKQLMAQKNTITVESDKIVAE